MRSWVEPIHRRLLVYRALALITAKGYLSYGLWFWSLAASQVFLMVIFYKFWSSVYVGRQTLNGLTASQMIGYILLAQVVAPGLRHGITLEMGQMVREGRIAIELLRPLDLQEALGVRSLTRLGCTLAHQSLTAGIVAVAFLGVRLPTSPKVWAAFAVSFVLGSLVMFFFDWSFACLTFFTTEAFGLYILREGLVLFFGGALLPLSLLPEGLRELASLLPFQQALAVPVSLLSGTLSISSAPQLWGTQILWVLGLALASRLIFKISLRKVVIQSG